MLNDFSDWLGKNYDYNWNLTLLAKRGVGVHNGSLHRSLSQIQIKLFEENEGLNRLISTSSIIEGVNTSAENVIVWMTSGRGLQFSNFAYKNLIGRAGRMFKHFIGNIYVLAKRPNDTETQLAIPFPEEILGDLDKEKYEKILTREQVAKIDEHDKEMLNLVGNAYKEYKNDSILQAQDSNLLKTIAHKLSSNPEAWECLKYLNYSNPDYWDAALYKILNLQPGAWDAKYGTFVEFVKILSGNWEKTIPELLQDLDDIGIATDKRGIVVDENFRTNVDGIYAIGDVNGICQLAHAAKYQGKRALNNILGKPDSFNFDVIPAAVFTQPEFSMVGKTEDACIADGIEYITRKVLFRANGKALALGSTEGLAKMILSPSGKILGCHILGPHASDLIEEVAVVMQQGGTCADIYQTIHAHPTLCEVVCDVASE